jgi:hypothetical protein
MIVLLSQAKFAFASNDATFTTVQSIGGSEPGWLLSQVIPQLKRR